jgi:hypothetical protein
MKLVPQKSGELPDIHHKFGEFGRNLAVQIVNIPGRGEPIDIRNVLASTIVLTVLVATEEGGLTP